MTFTESIRRHNPPEQMDLLEALTLVQEHANKEWFSAALKQVHWLCLSRKEFTTDDVHAVLDRMDVATHEKRALGAVMREAAKKGWCRGTSNYTPSIRKEAHKRPLMIWESLKMGGPSGAADAA